MTAGLLTQRDRAAACFVLALAIACSVAVSAFRPDLEFAAAGESVAQHETVLRNVQQELRQTEAARDAIRKAVTGP